MRSTLIPALVLVLLASTALDGHASPSPLDDATQELGRLQTQVKAAETIGRKDLVVKELRQLRNYQTRYGALDSAMRTSLRIVSMTGATTDRTAMAEDWQALARLGRNTGDLSQAVAAAKRAVLILKTTVDRERRNSATLELLDLLLEAKRYTEFNHLSEEALLNFRTERDLAGQAEVLYWQGQCLIGEGRAADALSLLHLALRNRGAIRDDKVTAKILFALARANAEIAEWAPARAAMEEALRLDPQAPKSVPGLHGLCASIDEGVGDLPAALHCLQQERFVKDSLTSAGIAERMTRIQAMYAVRAKDKAVEELHELNRALTLQLADKRTTTRWALMACAGLSVGMLVLLMLRGMRSSTMRRVRLRNAVIVRQADEIQARSTELEKQNLHLSQALVRDGNNRQQGAGQDFLAGNGIQLMDLLVRTQKENTDNEGLAAAIDALHGRVRAMALVNENLGKEGTRGRLHLKAHFASLADMLLRERGLLDRTMVDLDISGEDAFMQDLLPLSLLVNELLQISLAHASGMNTRSRITISLRRLGEHQCELLYSDTNGSITKDHIHNGSVGADLVQALARTLDGTIMLLKGEATTFQLTYQPGTAMELRRAS
ncbi:MAG: sensor histidine kinase [Flavobacteriales bacterium]|nr:sensor histidine kinase [Flavobacteriales bacterium]MBK6893976.1 sensor histidine kinase [Flavobacteriales bacterium]MBK7247923.1 sensor histidine kinase [Flavobacteriales bacterium]MBK9060842.1 sensor histidine kinase [Flavobacteriales bacterium]MBK9598991.1 sensor histidine kinase [Flavobacteriales bacterium]